MQNTHEHITCKWCMMGILRKSACMSLKLWAELATFFQLEATFIWRQNIFYLKPNLLDLGVAQFCKAWIKQAYHFKENN
jgi:hypothetical protein